MKMILIIVCGLGLLGSYGKSYSQSTRLSLNLKNSSIEEVLQLIEDQTNYSFMYDNQKIDVFRKVTIQVTDESVEDILKDLFEDNVKLQLFGNHIVLTPSNEVANQVQSSQQVKSVSGKITDPAGTALPGVTVAVKGTSKGVISDVNGSFTLRDVPAKGVLIFSFVGMKTQEISISGKTEFNIIMEENSIDLEEVVAVGYGTMKKADMTGSAGSVSATEIVKAPVKSFDEAMAGRIAGVYVSSDDGQPGALPNIIIRGANSLTQDNSPLYVIDGFPIEDYDNNSLNSNDIESIDVLKDASATAIYGARGANGVIMITTKRGKVGTPVITFNTYYGIQKDIKRMELLDAYEFVKVQLEAGGGTAVETYLTSQNRTLDDYKDIKGIDWNDKVLRIGTVRNSDLSISGGNQMSKYSVSVSNLDQEGIFINTGFKRYQGRITLDQSINKKVKVGINANYSETKDYGSIATTGDGTTLSLMASLWSYRPVLTNPTDEQLDLEEELSDPTIVTTADYRVNPYVQLKNELREKFSKNLFANAYVDIQLTKELKFKVTGGMSTNVKQNSGFYNSKTRTGSQGYPQSLGPNGSITTYFINSYTNENTLTYSKKFGKDHSLTVLAGYTQQKGKNSNIGAMAIQIANESLGLSGLDEGTPSSISSAFSEWALESYLSRVNYSYKSKYLLTASLRTDGSSKFSKTNRWGTFPSMALAYRLSSEPFMKKFEALSDAKLRFSYGATGNNRVSDFAYLSSIYTTQSSGYSFGNATPAKGTYPGFIGNADLKWETTYQLNGGFDVSFWKGRLSITGDYYRKKTNDLLLNAEVPAITGYTNAYKNIGSISNEGVELTINHSNKREAKLGWRTSLNISLNRSKILELTENQEALTTRAPSVFTNNPTYIAKLGAPVAQFYGVIYEGIYQYDDFDRTANGGYLLKSNLPTNGNTRANIQPGDARYKDLDNDGAITLNDYTVIGNPNPDFIGGFNNEFSYGAFDLTLFFQFTYGNDILNANRAVFENLNVSNQNQFASYANRWSPENQTSDIPRYKGSGQNLFTTRLIEDGSFLRLKTVSFGYDFQQNFIQRLHLKSLRAYVSAQNLITLTKYSGLDPEVSTRNTTLTPGFDWSAYPRSRTVTLGLTASF